MLTESTRTDLRYSLSPDPEIQSLEHFIYSREMFCAQRCPGQYKVKFTASEDARLKELVARYGTNSWSTIAAEMPDRNARQCRERWTNYINPSIVFSPWTASEEALLDQKFAEYGTNWQVIAAFFPNRSKNQIKNHWTTQHKRPAMVEPIQDQAVASETLPQNVAGIDQSVKATTLCDILFTEQDYQQFRWEALFGPLF
jgi:hypothetical protein